MKKVGLSVVLAVSLMGSEGQALKTKSRHGLKSGGMPSL